LRFVGFFGLIRRRRRTVLSTADFASGKAVSAEGRTYPVPSHKGQRRFGRSPPCILPVPLQFPHRSHALFIVTSCCAQIPLQTAAGKRNHKCGRMSCDLRPRAIERLEQGLYPYPRWRLAATLKELVLLMRDSALID
jgi:hypothetical protein